MRYISLILALLVALVATPAMATDLFQDQDFWGLENYFDIRTYHDSHPSSDTANNRGGWAFGIVFPASGDGDELVDKVVLEGAPSYEGGAVAKVVMDEPRVYPWLGETNYDFSTWIGHSAFFGFPVTITAYDAAGELINFHLSDGSVATSATVIPRRDAKLPPVPVIKRMAIKKDGQLMVKFTAPYDERSNQIRIRIFNTEGTGAEWQERFNPPYQFIKKDGTVVPDEMKILLPAEFAGRIARLEYRTFEHDDNYMCRGIVFFKLPELEE